MIGASRREGLRLDIVRLSHTNRSAVVEGYKKKRADVIRFFFCLFFSAFFLAAILLMKHPRSCLSGEHTL